MKLDKVLPLALVPAVVLADKAPKVKKNPADVIAIADFPAGGDKTVKGNVVFTAKEGKYVNVHLDMTGLPKSGGPFVYHIHEFPIPENGNCEAAGEHFNPYKAPADCDSQKKDDYCQVGDLSGKHGWINTTCFETKYDDPFLSLNSKSKSNIIGKSIVFHYANLEKFACANIVQADDSRINSLDQEYTSNGNEDLNELKQFIANDYQFQELEVYEADDAQDAEYDLKQRDLEQSFPLSHNHTDDDDCGKSNYTNATTNGINSECENEGNNLLFSGLTVGMGVLAGLLI